MGLLSTLPASLMAATTERGKGWEWGPMRWVQICATDDDPGRYDKQFWLDFLARTKTQGVCLSAGGVSAYYPTKVPYHYRSPYLGKGDMFGELVHACKKMGIRVLGRVDPHAMHDDALAAHPEWVARNADGSVKRHPTDPGLYLTCPNGKVTFEWMPQVLEEIVSTYPVDGIFGNRWAGSAGICHCDLCKSEFKAKSGLDLPTALSNPRDPAVRAYLIWDDEKRYAQLKLWTDTVQAINPNAFFTPGTWGRLDPRRLRETVRSIYADRQGRSGEGPAWLNGRSAKETYCLMQDRPMSGIFAVGETSTPYRFMDSVQSGPEIAAYLHDGLAHGFRPWMTKFKAEVFDKRWVPVIEKAYSWHAANEDYFRNTDNLARVAMVQSHQTSTYYTPDARRDTGAAGPMDAQTLRMGADDATNGYYQALVEARIPFCFADERQLDPEYIDRYKVLVLPNIAALSDRQCALLRGYVERGGALVATYETSLYDEWGQPRANFGLAELFGCDFKGQVDRRVQNSYLTVRGPGPLTVGIDDTPRIMGGTKLVHVTSRPGGEAPALTLVPSYPDLPMEKVFPTTRQTEVPMVYAGTFGKGRVVYIPTDLDRTFWECSSGDHLAVLRNAVLWAAGEEQPMTVKGPGFVDISLWRQQNSIAAHLVNLTNPMAMRGYMREILPAGPYEVSLRLPADAKVRRVRLLEAGTDAEAQNANGRLVVKIPSITLHEVIAIDLA
ncbi:alpha-amylase family protein [Novosphingobium flavum]|nr:alpha-amylase family protein [Novosphingobium flavum]